MGGGGGGAVDEFLINPLNMIRYVTCDTQFSRQTFGFNKFHTITENSRVRSGLMCVCGTERGQGGRGLVRAVSYPTTSEHSTFFQVGRKLC